MGCTYTADPPRLHDLLTRQSLSYSSIDLVVSQSAIDIQDGRLR